MDAESNVDRIRKGYAAFASGDMETVKELFAPDIVWHVPGDWELAGDYKGQDEVFGFFGSLLGAVENLEQNLLDVFANDHRGVAVLETTIKRAGRSHTGLQCHVLDIDAEGRVTEFWNCPYDQAAFQALFT